ncbi:MAG: cyclic lactone autoinducer peptide [Bacilli bacterium]|nr:cyclic lactone autoinducer peptide [Bacilli bacterium]CDC62172.1 unknown [Clostridium sp. CAG:417]
MKKKLAGVVAAVAMMLTGAASMGCMFILIDEPVAPNALID